MANAIIIPGDKRGVPALIRTNLPNNSSFMLDWNDRSKMRPSKRGKKKEESIPVARNFHNFPPIIRFIHHAMIPPSMLPKLPIQSGIVMNCGKNCSMMT